MATALGCQICNKIFAHETWCPIQVDLLTTGSPRNISEEDEIRLGSLGVTWNKVVPPEEE